MNPPRHAPQQLKYVAYAFLIEGCLCFASMIVAALIGNLFLNWGALVALLGWGLLRLNLRSYRWAYFLAWVYFAGTIYGLLFVGLPIFLDGLSPTSRDSLYMLPLTFCLLIFFLKLWQIGVLDSPPVRRAFGLPDRY